MRDTEEQESHCPLSPVPISPIIVPHTHCRVAQSPAQEMRVRLILDVERMRSDPIVEGALRPFKVGETGRRPLLIHDAAQSTMHDRNLQYILRNRAARVLCVLLGEFEVLLLGSLLQLPLLLHEGPQLLLLVTDG